jgi:hypothetical protein
VFDPKTKPWYRDEFIHPSEFEADLAHRPVSVEAPAAQRRQAPA